MFLKKYLTTSPKIKYPASRTLWDLLNIGPKIDPDRPTFVALVGVKEGAKLDGVKHARKIKGTSAYEVEFVSLNSLKKIVENPAVLRLSSFDQRAYPEEEIQKNYPKKAAKRNKGPKLF